MTAVRSPAVAGTFYPDDPRALAATVDALLAEADGSHHDKAAPKALVVPHAGYAYSGPVAASAYSRLRGARGRVRRVVLLGPVHRVPVRGLALPGCDAFATPLGRVPLDTAAIEAIRGFAQVCVSPEAHAAEHSLEVHLPFLQRVLPDFALVPLAVGDATADEVAAVLDALWGGDETLIVVSTDLSHHLPYDQARAIDAETAGLVLRLATDIDHRRACGGTALNGLMAAARRHGLEPQLVDLRNSGDTSGDERRVVGYASFVLAPPAVLEANAGNTLLAIARCAISRELGEAGSACETAGWLRSKGATFVTLEREGSLRGCIGSIEAQRPLLDDLKQNAIAAAFRDPRFAPLARDEWAATSVEVSLLSGLDPVPCATEKDVLDALRPGVDGLVLRYGHHRGTFLPQVWESIPDPAQFLMQLKRKAGLPPDFWEPGIELHAYGVTRWREGPERA